MSNPVVTAAGERILIASLQRGGVTVWGRQMGGVDRLKDAGLITVNWRIEGAGAISRWVGVARATTAGKKLVGRVRTEPPDSVKSLVAIRQLFEVKAWMKQFEREDGENHGAHLERLLVALAGNLGCAREDLRLDHEPALRRRPYDWRVKKVAARYTPNANDPAFLRYRTGTAHDVKTHRVGDGGQHPDRVLIAKARRLERPARPSDSRARPKLPKRKMQGSNRFPPKGTRKFQNRRT